ncbi:unnamed protein product, partial [Discosporangium mesarthrocarpum]
RGWICTPIDAVLPQQVKKKETDGYVALQVGVGESKPKNVTKPLREHFRKAGVKPKREVGLRIGRASGSPCPDPSP